MNIIKLLDVKMPETQPQADLFNKYLKGKYAYWVQMRYIVPFEFMRHEGYVACEEDITKLLQREDGTWPKPYGAPCLDIYDGKVAKYVDMIETDKINHIAEYRLKNKYVPDNEITLDELKKFRTWLASELLTIDQTDFGEQKNSFFTESETHVLQYYASNMYDNTIKILSEFGQESLQINNSINTHNCGCHTSSNLDELYFENYHICNPISIYKKNIYSKMVQMFSKIEFWSGWPKEFLDTIKQYIDGIISTNLPFGNITNENKFVDCNCITNNDFQKESLDILKRLSNAFEHMKNGDIVGHKNYIQDALRDWSSQLYESMQW